MCLLRQSEQTRQSEYINDRSRNSLTDYRAEKYILLNSWNFWFSQVLYLQSVHRDVGGNSWNFQTPWKIYSSIRSKTRWSASLTQISFNPAIHYQGRCIHRMFLRNISALQAIFRYQSSESKRVQFSNSFKKQTFKNTRILLQNYSLRSKFYERASRQSSDTYNRRSLLSKLN